MKDGQRGKKKMPTVLCESGKSCDIHDEVQRLTAS